MSEGSQSASADETCSSHRNKASQKCGAFLRKHVFHLHHLLAIRWQKIHRAYGDQAQNLWERGSGTIVVGKITLSK